MRVLEIAKSDGWATATAYEEMRSDPVGEDKLLNQVRANMAHKTPRKADKTFGSGSGSRREKRGYHPYPEMNFATGGTFPGYVQIPSQPYAGTQQVINSPLAYASNMLSGGSSASTLISPERVGRPLICYKCQQPGHKSNVCTNAPNVNK